MKFYCLLAAWLLLAAASHAQPYTAYFTGDPTDTVTAPAGGVCLMGGATEDDNAMRWFLERADGGDVLVLRASGSDGYQEYLHDELGVAVNSVTTIVFDGPAAATDSFVLAQIVRAEAIWLAGGDQWNYVSYWRGTPVDSLLNAAVAERSAVVGGTSAGMAVLGGYYFSAQNGTVTSETALANPYVPTVAVDSAAFLRVPFLADVVTDTHYDEPDRRGRHVTFLARILADYGVAARGIACDEYTAVCVDSAGQARVFGAFPDFDDNAYFVQLNCEADSLAPETLAPGQPLDWRRDSLALRVYRAQGTPGGTTTFDLTDWQTGAGGTWESWFVADGTLQTADGTAPDCNELPTALPAASATALRVYPNPAHDQVRVSAPGLRAVVLTDLRGRPLRQVAARQAGSLTLNAGTLPPGVYVLRPVTAGGTVRPQRLVVR